MSFIYKCDVCGKDSAMTGVRFTTDILELNVDTYNGSKMNVKLNIGIEDLVDSENVQKMEMMLNTLTNQKMRGESEEFSEENENPDAEPMDKFQLYQETIYENLDKFMSVFKDNLVYMGDSIGIKLNTPNAMICDTCKRELAYRVLTEGSYKKDSDVLGYLYSTDSQRVPPLPPPTLELTNEVEETTPITVIKRGSWYELPDGKKVRKAELPNNVIIKDEKDDNI